MTQESITGNVCDDRHGLSHRAQTWLGNVRVGFGLADNTGGLDIRSVGVVRMKCILVVSRTGSVAQRWIDCDRQRCGV